MTCSRRDLCGLLAGLAASPGIAVQNNELLSRTFRYEGMPVRKNGENELRPVLSGELHNGSYLEVHETRLAPGGMPHPAHHHLHEEMFLVRAGTIEVTTNGKPSQLGPGSVAFVKSNDEHGIRNAGTTPAEYFVVELGKG